MQNLEMLSINNGWRWFSVGALLLVLVCGCTDSSTGAKRFPVKGTITVDGAPLSQGTILFVPESTTGDGSSEELRGTIAADGTYSLHAGDLEGAPAGWYRIAIYASDATDSITAPKPLVAEKYNNPETSGLRVEVKADAERGAYDLQVEK